MPLPFFDYDLESPAPSPGGTPTASPGLIAQALVGQEFDTAKRLELPGWMRLQEPGDGRTARVGVSTAAVFGEHEPRFYSDDGVTFGLLVEPAQANSITEQDLSAWTDTGTPVLSNAITPIGTTEAVELLDDSAAAQERKTLTIGGLSTGKWSLSSWSQLLTPAATTIGFAPIVSGNTPDLEIDVTTVDAAWTYRSHSVTVTVTGGSSSVILFPRQTTADTGAVRMWGSMLEKRAYPTSFYDGTREATVLEAQGSVLAPDGRFLIRLKYRPHYAQGEPSLNHSLVRFDDANKLIYNNGATRFDLVIGGVTLSSAAVTFSRHQELTITIEHSEVKRSITVEGATTGNGQTTAAAADALSSVPTWVTILNGADGTTEGGDLLALVPGLETFCQLADERVLVQIDDENDRVFRELVCVLAEQPGRFYDVTLALRAAFDLDSAVGAQLDLIGAWIGLAREGFTDTRYRVFLSIQAQLLLSAQRVDSAWTGTGENILTIARTFLGPGVDPILLVNEPPYSYELTVPGLVLSEAFLLARFLTIANYAAVLGLMLISLGIGGVMGSSSVAVTGAGIMGSASVAVAGAMIMGTVVTT
jgi:hypothetical protein